MLHVTNDEAAAGALRAAAPEGEVLPWGPAAHERLRAALAGGEQIVLWLEDTPADRRRLDEVLSFATPADRVELVRAEGPLAHLAPSELGDLWAVRHVLAPGSIVDAQDRIQALKDGRDRV